MIADPSKIAAGATGQGPGSSTNAIAMVALQNARHDRLGTTFDDYYTGIVSGMALAAQTARAARSTRSTIVVNAPVGPARARSRASRSTRR